MTKEKKEKKGKKKKKTYYYAVVSGSNPGVYKNQYSKLIQELI